MSTENIVTGKFYRILKDKTNDIWDRISLWTHSDDVQTASGITLTTDLSRKESKISSTQSDFAKVETSSVASQAYVKGNMLVYNNQLYRVKAAIASGGTLTPGTNIEAVNVGTISNMLNTSDGKGFYFDVKDGSYGFYPSASKVASEFVPFGGSTPNTFAVADTDLGNRCTGSIYFTKNQLRNYTKFCISRVLGSQSWYNSSYCFSNDANGSFVSGSNVTIQALNTYYNIPTVPDGGYFYIWGRVNGTGSYTNALNIFEVMFS